MKVEMKNTIFKYFYEAKRHPIRMAVSGIFSVCLLLLTFALVGMCGGKRSLISLALCVGSGLLISLPKWNNKLSILALLIYLLYVPLKIFQRIELPFHDLSRLVDGVTSLSVWMILCIYLLVFLVTQRSNLALGIGNIIILILFLCEYFVYEFRGTIITPTDISAVGTAMAVVRNYQFHLSAEAWYTVLYIIAFTVFGFHIRIQGGKAYHILGTVSALLLIGGFYFTVMYSSYLEEHNITGHYWNMSENQLLNGTFLSFLVICGESEMKVPADYSYQNIEKIAVTAEEEYEGPKSSGAKPNIIMIMNEAWSDLAVLGDLDTTADYMPFTHSLTENTIKGNLHVSVLGGLTANTEFEALTGDSLSLLSHTVIPYQNQLDHEIYALPRILKEEGYDTLAMHPSGKNAWNRDTVYRYMGFDNFIGEADFETDYEYERMFLSDKCNFQEIIYRYEQRDDEKPFFLFDVTIQNHGGYYGDIELPIEVESINGVAAEQISYTYDLQTYLNLIAITDEAFEELITYFSQQEEPTIICMFGDHQPRLEDVFYDTMFQDRDLSEQEKNMLTYITPYVIWSNYDMEETDYGDISANYLPAVLMEVADMELPSYYKFLLNTMQEYPILSLPACVDKNGNVMTVDELSGEERIDDYRMLQYNQLYDDETLKSVFANIPWYDQYSVICHALGMTEQGDTLTNSKEAFLYNYEKGQRVFEADVQITSDSVMVLRHDWNSDLGQASEFGWTDTEKTVPTAEKFLETPIYGQYTPLSLEEWFDIMEKYPDIYMVTDTKYSTEVSKQFQLFVDTALKNGHESVLERVIVQLYYKDMYEEVMEVYPFRNVLWTLYYIGYPGKEDISEFVSSRNIPVVVMVSSWWYGQQQADLEEMDVKVYLHTVNEELEAQDVLHRGADGIYTDVLTNEQVEGWKRDGQF